jgi:hypothetical protein
MNEEKIMDYHNILEKAREWGCQKHPQANNYRHAAFANSVAYLVVGVSGGYGGPSIREHAVSYAIAGDGFNLPANTSMGTLTVQFPDGRLPSSGEWDFDSACLFAEPIVYGRLPASSRKIIQQEHCFNDDPADLEELRLNLS